MSPPQILSFSTLLLLALSCASTPQPEKDPSLEREALERRKEREEALRRQGSLPLVLTRLDQAMAEYVTNVGKADSPKAEQRAEALRSYLEAQSKRFMPELLAALGEAEARNRGIAAGALGFSGEDAALAPILNALEDSEALVRVNACLGIGMLAKPRTPLDTLNRILRDPEQPTQVRRSASWALVRLQRAGAARENFERIWPEILAGDPLAGDEIVVVHALRGLGLLRSPNLLDPALRYFSHSKPFVRQAALVAAARSTNRAAAARILPFLSPTETNPNVRLTARKALKALTNDRVDHEYNLKAWKQEFDLPDGGA